MARVDRLCRAAEVLQAPFVSEHVAFVRAGGTDAGHLLPVERSARSLDVMVSNVRAVQRVLPVPLALENIATLIRWPGDTMNEATFLSSLVAATGVGLLFDASNAYANAVNHDEPIDALLDGLPLEAIRYVHIAGGAYVAELYHDTHAHPLSQGPLDVLRALCERIAPPAVVLERERQFGSREELEAELEAVAGVLKSCAGVTDSDLGEAPRS